MMNRIRILGAFFFLQFLGCSSNVISIKIQDYNVELIDKGSTAWYPFKGSRLDSLITVKCSHVENRMYFYESKDPLFAGSSDAVHNYVRGYIEYAHFENNTDRQMFQCALLMLKSEADCIIGIGSDLYAIDDESDIQIVITSIKERIAASGVSKSKDMNVWIKTFEK